MSWDYPRRSTEFGIAGLALLAIIALGGGLWLYGVMRESTPQLSGRLTLSGLSQPVSMTRDELGIPTLVGANRVDIARALGFVHAQERFFQMDLLRRNAAGELAELVGAKALPLDRRHRLHRLRGVARSSVEMLGADDRALLLAYVDGVNAGLAALGSKPFEYWVLHSEPQPWRAEDSVLVVLAMFLDLQDSNAGRDNTLGLLATHLPAEAFEFLVPRGTEWDAALTGERLAEAAVPDIGVYNPRRDVKGMNAQARAPLSEQDYAHAVGSNNLAVAGRLTDHGAALVAGDMHLQLRVPNIWFRAAWRQIEAQGAGEQSRIVGVTLPGTPVMVAGSNGRIAWTFTNSYGDFSDLIVIERAPDRPDHYLTSTGLEPLTVVREEIRVRGEATQELNVITTRWGPIVDADEKGRYRALRWVGHDPRALNLVLRELESAGDVNAALPIANRAGIPAQNFIVGDVHGNIAWTIGGRLPKRAGAAASVPISWRQAEHAWQGWLDPADYPRVVNPESGYLWTANNRVGDDAVTALLGDGGFQLGARARQIRDGLAKLSHAREQDLLAVQLDDRALFLGRWQELLLSLLSDDVVRGHPQRQQLRELVRNWSGRAEPSDAGYRLVRAFRQFLAEQVFGYLLAPIKSGDARLDYLRQAQWESPLWRMVTQRPPHLLNPEFADWDAQLLAAMDATLAYFDKLGGTLAEHTWGERNRLAMQHPFSGALPLVGDWLNMPPESLPGDTDMPRVQGPDFGASQRMVIAPGHEESALLHMPGGQSGHPLSPFYGKGHEAWADGAPAPLLPGSARYTLDLVPG